MCCKASRSAASPLALGGEAIRVGQAPGYRLEEILHLPPETIARAGEGDEAAMRACDEQRFNDGKRTSSGQRPSMGQDMQKGRRTEIELLNGFVVREGEKVGLACSANAVLTDLVKPHLRAFPQRLLTRPLFIGRGLDQSSPRHFYSQRALGSQHYSGARTCLAEVLHFLGSPRELIEVDDGVANTRIVIATEPHRQAGEILEAELCQLAAGQLAHIDGHFFLGANR
jgi:Ketopantoate reductase PanE/ApbA C terminal